MPRPRRDPLSYAAARVLEALLEAVLALEYLGKGYTRNAAGKAFQAWRALTGALLALEEEKLGKYVSDEERKWLIEVAIPRVPSSRLKPSPSSCQGFSKTGLYVESQSLRFLVEPPRNTICDTYSIYPGRIE